MKKRSCYGLFGVLNMNEFCILASKWRFERNNFKILNFDLNIFLTEENLYSLVK